MKKIWQPTVGAQSWSFFLVSPKSKHLIDDDGDRAFAICDYEKCRCYISSALHGSALDDAVWHELFHVFYHVIGAQQVHEANEAQVAALAPQVHRLLGDEGFSFKFLKGFP